MKATRNNRNADSRIYLLLVGVFLLVAGASAGVVSGAWNELPVGLMVTGALMLVVWLAAQKNLGGFFGQRSTQAGTNALLSVLAILVILGLANFLGVRYNRSFDLTENQLFTLAPQTQEVLQSLDRPVALLVFDRTLAPSDRELLENYAAAGDRFSFELVDPAAEFGLSQQFEVTNFGETYLVLGDREANPTGDRQQFLATLGETQGLREPELTAAIEQLAGDRQETAYFLQGHGERPLDVSQGSIFQATNALEAKNFASETLNLAQDGTVPEDARLVAIVGPQRSLLEGEVDALRDYLDGGGSVLALLDPDSDGGLSGLLEEWGVTLDDRPIVDASQVGQLVGLGPDAPLVTDYGEHPIVDDFQEGISFYPRARSLSVTEVPGIESAVLMRTNEQSWAESDPTQDPLRLDPGSDEQGPLVLGVALEKLAPPEALPDAAPIPEALPEIEEDPEDAPEGDTEATDPDAIDGEATDEDAATETEEDPAEEAPAGEEPAGEGADDNDAENGAADEAEEDPEDDRSSIPGWRWLGRLTGGPAIAQEPDPEAIEPEVLDPEDADPEETEEAPETEAPETEAADREPTPRLVVIGNSTFAADGLFDQQLNGDIFVNSVSWLADRGDEALSVRPREPENRRFTLTPFEGNLLGWMAIVLFPLLGFVAAGTLWWQQR